MKNQMAVMTKPAPIMPKMAKMAPVGTEVGGMTPAPGRQLGFVASFWRLSMLLIEESRTGGALLRARTARSLMEDPERWARERKDERDEVVVSGTGAMVAVLT